MYRSRAAIERDSVWARRELVQRLRGRVEEIEATIAVRVAAVSELPREEPEYLDGLRGAVSAAVDHGLRALEASGEASIPTPAALLLQARLAARMDVPLDAVLRRYFAGYTVLLDYVVAEARAADAFDPEALQALLRRQGIVHERVAGDVSEEYLREPKHTPPSLAEQKAIAVRRLLDGELIDTRRLEYEFDGYHHHGVVARGAGCEEAVRELASMVDCRHLTVIGAPEGCWGWLGTREPLDVALLTEEAKSLPGPPPAVALGEPALGIAGWRLSHRQARAAMMVAARRGDRVVRYAEVALLASLLHDELLAESLRAIYLDPLEEDRNGGEIARRTLRAYFRAGRNVSSAAAALGINRQTVAKRLRAIDDRLGGVLAERGPDLEAALHLEQLNSAAVATDSIAPRAPGMREGGKLEERI